MDARGGMLKRAATQFCVELSRRIAATWSLNNQLAGPKAEGKSGRGKKRSAEASDAEAEVEEA